jgi:hypothetical protein
MSRLPFELILALRYLQPKPDISVNRSRLCGFRAIV